MATRRKNVKQKRVTSTIAFDGAALRGGEMDVRDLAPALLAFGDLVRDANRRLNGGRAEVKVVVKSRFRKGSFATTISLIQNLLQHAANLFDPVALHDAAALAKLLALTAYAEGPKEVIENIFELLKFLGGTEPKAKEPLPDGSVRITNSRGDTTIVNNGTLILVEDNSVRNDVRRLLAPLQTAGIETFETRAPSGQAIEKITKAELPAIVAPRPAVEESAVEVAEQIETRSTGFFQIVSLTFREGNKWKVSAGQGDFWAEMADPVFLTKMHRREIGFFEGDVLRAEYVNVASRRAGKIETETKIVNVVEIIPGEAGTVQAELPSSP